MGDEGEETECYHCGHVGDSASFEVDEDATEAMENAMHGDVGFICVCPECGGTLTLA